jgi:hypothetical protein
MRVERVRAVSTQVPMYSTPVDVELKKIYSIQTFLHFTKMQPCE